LGVVDETGHFQPLDVTELTRADFGVAIKTHSKAHNVAAGTHRSTASPLEVDNSTDSVTQLLDNFYYDKAKLLTPIPLFRADLEQAIRFALDHEIPQHSTIAGDALMALRHFVSVLERYYKYGNRQSFRRLLDFLMEPSRTEIDGQEFQTYVRKLDPPVVHQSRYVGCFSTSAGRRRFPCSLWSLFHHLTVQEFEEETAEDPMEVLQAMHGYVKHFFGCTECSKHFQAMSTKNRIWNVTSKDQAVLWVWAAHNEVNQRLAGDVTEDSNHPKVQWPSEEQCSECRKHNGEWDKNEVLEFLKRHYGNEAISELGMDFLPHAKMFKVRARQIFQSADHLHVGIFAYLIIIICLMTAAVRFYFRRGYRKKLYLHDLLGKV